MASGYAALEGATGRKSNRMCVFTEAAQIDAVETVFLGGARERAPRPGIRQPLPVGGADGERCRAERCSGAAFPASERMMDRLGSAR